MLNIEYFRTYFYFPLQFFSLNLVFWKFQHFWKVILISVKIAKYPVIFGGEFWSLGDQEMVLQLLQSICCRKKMAYSQQILRKTIWNLKI